MKETGTYVALGKQHSVFEGDPEGFRDETGKVLRQFGPLREINLIVGPNNSGKSRFVRGLFRDPQEKNNQRIWGQGPLDHWIALEESVDLLANVEWSVEPTTKLRRISGSELRGLLMNAKETPFTRPDFGSFVTLVSQVPDSLLMDTGRFWFEHDRTETTPTDEERGAVAALIDWAKWRRDVEVNQREWKCLYIPQLRTALRLSGANEELYSSNLSSLYSLSDRSSMHTGQNLHETMDRKFRGSRTDRDKFRRFQSWFQQTFFPGKSVEFIPRHGEAGNQIAIDIDGEDRDIQHLGDGIQHIVLLTFPLFMAEKGTIAFIEEPETHLHPGLQRVFFETLLSDELKDNDLKVVCTTHSNHLLDMAFQHLNRSSIFSFSRVFEPPGKRYVRIEHIQQRAVELLDNLGVRNSSVFLSQSTVWVEGPSDVISYRAYYRAYQDQLFSGSGYTGERMMEGRDFAFVQYGGSCLSTLSFDDNNDDTEQTSAWKLANRVFLIADQDERKQSKHAKYEELAKRMQNLQYNKLEVRELENLISHQLWEEIFNKVFPNAAGLKTDGFKVDAMTRVGIHFQGVTWSKGNKTWQVTPDTIDRKKTEIARVLEQLPVTWEQMSPPAKKLMFALDDFIRTSCGFKTVEDAIKDRMLLSTTQTTSK